MCARSSVDIHRYKLQKCLPSRDLFMPDWCQLPTDGDCSRMRTVDMLGGRGGGESGQWSLMCESPGRGQSRSWSLTPSIGSSSRSHSSQ